MLNIRLILFTYNRLPLLKKAVESIKRQIETPNAELRVLLIDDGSTDGTQEYLDQQKEFDIKLCSHRGIPFVRNEALSWLAGCPRTPDYVVWMGSDDKLSPEFLARSAKLLVDQPEIDVLYHKLVVNGNVTWEYPDYKDDILQLAKDAISRGANALPDPGSLVRYSVIQQTGLYDEQLLVSSDSDYGMRRAPFLRYVKYSDLPLYLYTWNDKSISRSEVNKGPLLRRMFSKSFAEHLSRWPELEFLIQFQKNTWCGGLSNV